MHEPDYVDECYADKDLSLLKKLTLVIPTYNRNYYLSRCLWYHAHFPFSEIIVADSSPEEKKVVNRETVAKVREMFGVNVRYLEYEPETEKYGGDIYRKWGDAVQHVETEYSQIVTDKEFLNPLALFNCIKNLSSNKETVAAHGKEYSLFSEKNQISGDNNYYLRFRHPMRNAELNNCALERFDHAIAQVPAFSNSLLLATWKTSSLIELYNIFFLYNFTDIRYGEVFLGYTGYLMGRVCCVDDIVYRVRDEVHIKLDRDQKGSFWCKSAESSTSRYPTINEYRNLGFCNIFYPIYYNALLFCLQKFAYLTASEASMYLKKREILLINILQMGGILNRILHCCSPLKDIWYNIPNSCRKSIQTIIYYIADIKLPLNRVGEKLTITTAPIQIIVKIVADTAQLHNLDFPIV